MRNWPPGNNLLFFLPRVANSLHPVPVTAPSVESLGDHGVTAAGLVRILRHSNCQFNSSRFDARHSAAHLRNSSRRFVVAHLACLLSTGTVSQVGSHRRQACVSICDGHLKALRSKLNNGMSRFSNCRAAVILRVCTAAFGRPESDTPEPRASGLTREPSFTEATWMPTTLGNARFRAAGQTSNLSMRLAAMTQI